MSLNIEGTEQPLARDYSVFKILGAIVAIVFVSVLVAFLVGPGTGFSSLGFFLARYIVSEQGLAGLGPTLFVGLAIDTMSCWVVFLGLYVLRRAAPEMNPESEGHHWQRPTVGSMLCAAPLSYYFMLGEAVYMSGGRMPQPASMLVASFLFNFAFAAAVVFAIYASFVILFAQHSKKVSG